MKSFSFVCIEQYWAIRQQSFMGYIISFTRCIFISLMYVNVPEFEI